MKVTERRKTPFILGLEGWAGFGQQKTEECILGREKSQQMASNKFEKWGEKKDQPVSSVLVKEEIMTLPRRLKCRNESCVTAGSRASNLVNRIAESNTGLPVRCEFQINNIIIV